MVLAVVAEAERGEYGGGTTRVELASEPAGTLPTVAAASACRPANPPCSLSRRALPSWPAPHHS